MKKTRPKLGDILHVLLLDHASADGTTERGAIPFEVFGRIVYEDRNCYELAYWHNPNTLNIEHDTETIVVVKGAIQSYKILK